jgi:S-disulfanyl-L-cysteine oxidoreductase SoxD
LFDFTRRAMPMTAPGTLSNDEVYAVTAYLLNLSGVIGENDDINAETLPKIRMPNRDGFVWIDVPKSPR